MKKGTPKLENWFHCRKLIRLSPAPVQLVESDLEIALNLLQRITNGPDEEIFNALDEARDFLKTKSNPAY